LSIRSKEPLEISNGRFSFMIRPKLDAEIFYASRL